jgi:5'-nucleotidase
VAYLKAHSPDSPDLAQRAVGVVLTPPADGEAYAAGESVTATLSSMLFSHGEATGDATVKLGDEVLGSAPLDPEVVPTTDEQGRASVEFTIPDGVTGDQVLTITGPGGTSIDYPVTIAAPPAAEVRTHTLAGPDQVLSVTGKNIGFTARVRAADGSDPVGEVTVYDGTHAIATAELTAGDHGRVHLTLPKLDRGIHLLRAVFAGDGYTTSRSNLSVVLVLRR